MTCLSFNCFFHLVHPNLLDRFIQDKSLCTLHRYEIFILLVLCVYDQVQGRSQVTSFYFVQISTNSVDLLKQEKNVITRTKKEKEKINY